MKTEARTGAADVFSDAPDVRADEFADAGVRGDVGFEELPGPVESPTFTKLNLRLVIVSACSLSWTVGEANRNMPSVRILRSCKMNQIPSLWFWSCNRKALALNAPMRLRVNMPVG